MTHVVTQSCCSDGSCVYACPVNCIQPTPDDPGFATAEMLYIDPATCVDCGACVSACPVEAIKPHWKLGDGEMPFLEINRSFHHVRRERPLLAPVLPPLGVRMRGEQLRVAIVGSGPAAMYAADELLTIPGAQVDVYERLPIPFGLARFGVAPDHRRTRRMVDQLQRISRQEGLTLFTGVEVGRDVSHAELLAGHHAVLYAAGAATDRPLGIPGAELPGSTSATAFVGWYNGHPDFRQRTFDLSHERAVVIGNGNVALDVARILTVDPDTLADTDIAPAALAALRASRVREVVVVGRRSAAHSSFTLPELVGLAGTGGVEVIVDAADRDAEKLRPLRDRPPVPGARRIVLRYRRSPVRVLGDDRATGVTLGVNQIDGSGGIVPTGRQETLRAGLVLSSIGYRALPMPGLPFDEATATVPHDRGRVQNPASGEAVPGTYVTGWIKRGPTGFIGTNKSDAQETVATLVDDWNAGRLPAPGAIHETSLSR